MLALGWGVLMSAPLAGQISPGPLATPHASLEGPTQCTTCHGNRRDAMTGQCAACHKDIGWGQQQGRGYHGSAEVKATPCASCHPDHAGKEFDMVKWPDGGAKTFDHKRAGWALAQEHAKATCEDCHATKFQMPTVKRLSVRKTGQGYTALDTTCTACHEDIHRGALKQDCTVCHDAGSWTVTPGFDHDITAYPLADKHAKVKCDECHLDPRLSPPSDGKGHLVPVYQPVPFESCANCHADPHNGGLGPKCADCHTTPGFQVIDKNRFDHARTKYPLAGKHATVSCAACHKDFSTPALKRPAFATCASCHKDAHGGTATLAGKPVDCASCHTVNGYVPSTYTVASHATTKYPLEGKHTAVKCGACHTRSTTATAAAKFGTAKVVMRPAFAACTDCHADDHGGQLKARADRGQCSACHRVSGWTPSSFDSAAHATLKLGLDGKHQQIECVACHGAARPNLPPVSRTAVLGKANFLFAVPELECAACHTDPHEGRFVTGGARVQAAGCPACHSTRAFRPSSATVAVHARFSFPLEGAHRATACSACHKELLAPGVAQKQSSMRLGSGRFGALQFEAKHECVDCHTTPHGTQFDARQGGCAACHTADAFAPAGTFDHTRDASFSLKGAHEKVPCAQCHKPDPKNADPKGVIYRPLSGQCESCHGKESQ